MPRVNLQWLFHDGTGLQSHVFGQIGHHSNGQTGCLYVWTGLDRDDPERCVRHATDTEAPAPKATEEFVRGYYWRSADVEAPSDGDLCDRASELQRGYVAVDVCGGNFSVNYLRIGYDMAKYGHHSWRWGARYEWHPEQWMYGPLREFYPRWRLGLVTGMSLPKPKPCERVDLFGDFGWHERASDFTDRVSIEVRALCMLSESPGLGLFVRYYKGQDYYNASFLEPLNRWHVGLTINNWRAFGAG